MKRLLLGMAPTLVLLAGIGCSSDPLGDLQNGMDHLTATPSQMFLQPGETKTVLVSGFDAQGNPQSADYVVSDPGSNIAIKRDSTFLPDFINDSTLQVPPTAPTYRFIVTSTGYGATSFTITADGKSVTVPVQNAAQTVLAAEVSDTEPALGEVVTITLPAGVSFSPTTTVTLADPLAVQPFAVTIAPDNKSLTFLPPPNMTSQQLIISDVVSDAVPGTPFSPVTAQRFTTPQLTALNATISNLAPAALQQITVTINGGATFDPATTFTIGANAAIITNLTTTSATLLPIPGSSGLLTATNVIPDTLPQYSIPLSSTDTVTAGALTPLTGTEDISTAPTLAVPTAGNTTTLNDAGGFDGDGTGCCFGGGVRFYKIVLGSTTTLTGTLDWFEGQDLGLYWVPPMVSRLSAISTAIHRAPVAIPRPARSR
jgi:hypothetical protein